jgi:hypothetical protein
VATLDDSERRKNLRRLLRFVERREARDGRVLTRSDYARFFLAYDPAEGAGSRTGARSRSARPGARPLHRLGWLARAPVRAPGRRARRLGTAARSEHGV